jgi:hypothetical protein
MNKQPAAWMKGKKIDKVYIQTVTNARVIQNLVREHLRLPEQKIYTQDLKQVE